MIEESPGLVVARAPLRVSLAGGGTDLPSYATRFGGLVISLAIDRYVGVATFPRQFGGGLRAAFEGVENVADSDELRNRFARAALLRCGVRRDLQLASFADAPSGTGLGGSGAFTVALLHALTHRRQPDARTLAEQASAVEIVDLERPVGKHDHYMAAVGGLQALHIGEDVQLESLPSPAPVEQYLADRLQLYYTGLSRDAGQVLAAQDRLTRSGSRDVLDPLHAIRELAEELIESLRAGETERIGPILDRHWRYKRTLSNRVSTARIDELYDTALAAGAQGGKLLGAGGGGFLLLAVHEGEQERVRKAMQVAGARELEFRLSRTGSTATELAL